VVRRTEGAGRRALTASEWRAGIVLSRSGPTLPVSLSQREDRWWRRPFKSWHRVSRLRGQPDRLSVEHCQGRRLAKRADIEMALRELAPRIPPYEFGVVVDHAVDSRGLAGGSAQAAAWLALVSYVRHGFTDYDALLEQGYDRDSARFFVAAEIDAVLNRWGVRRRLSSDD
jgi:hypothetical protein